MAGISEPIPLAKKQKISGSDSDIGMAQPVAEGSDDNESNESRLRRELQDQQTLLLELLRERANGKKLPDMEALWKKLETVDITEDDMLVLPKGAMKLLGSGSSESREMVMYVRPCYKDLYDLIYGEYETKHIIVVGNPGIGKSYFLLYLMFRLRKKDKDMPLFFSSAITSLHVLFDKDGVTEYAENFVKKHKPMTNMPYLFDCGTRGHITPSLSQKTIISTSPDYGHYKAFLKLADDHCGVGAVLLYMPPWSLDELEHVSKYFQFQVEDMHENYKIVGGIPRKVFSKSMQIHKDAIDQAISNSSLSKIVQMAKELPGDVPSKTSYSLLQLKPKDNDRTYQARDVMFASDYVVKKIIASYKSACVTHMRAILTPDREYSGIEGQMFEYLAHMELPSGKVFPVRSLDNNNVESTLDLRAQTVTVLFKNVKDLAEHKITSGGKYPKNVYLRPEQRNFVSLDSIMLIGGTDRAIGFQMTIKKKRPIVKKGLQEIRQTLLCDRDHRFEIYFVVPKVVEEAYTVPQSYLGTRQKVLTSAIPINIQQYVLPLDIQLFEA